MNKIKTYYFYLPLLLLCIFYAYKSFAFPIHDFANYYFGGKLLADGNFNSNIYFPYEFNKAISNLGYQNIFVSYAPNTPFLALFFSGFSFIPVAIAKLIFNCVSIGLFVISIYRLFSFYKINPKFALLIPILFLIPIKNNLLFGQVYFLLFFLLAEGLIAYENQRWKLVALFWSLAILLKVFPVIIVLFLLFKKQWKPIFYLALSCFLLFGITTLFNGFDVWIFFFKEVLPKASNGEIASSFVDNYQSVFMFLKRLLVFNATDNQFAFFNYPVLFSALILAFKIGFITLGYFISKNSKNNLQLFSFWVLAMILLSPYGSTYTFILMLFPFFALLKSEISNIKKIVFCLILFFINNLPLSLFIEKEFPFSYLRLFLLLLFLILILIDFQQKINWKIISVFALVPMILIPIFKKEETVESTILFKNGPIFMYTYDVVTIPFDQSKCITARFWDGSEKKIYWKLNYKTAKPLEIKNNQIFYRNQQITFDKSNKRKAVLLNNKTIMYLSDYDRGIGFYTLRKIELH